MMMMMMIVVVQSWKIPTSSSSMSRCDFWKVMNRLPIYYSTILITATATTTTTAARMVQAAPPIAIIAQELGYFPVTNSLGETVYVPKSVQRESSEQAMALAQHLRSIGARMYGAYWCPHCARQRELFGRQAWNNILSKDEVEFGSSGSSGSSSNTGNVVSIECSPQGYRNQAALCLPPINTHIDGFPTWKIHNKYFGGERDLSELAQLSGFPKVWDSTLETNLPPPIGSSSCRF
jgi:hypothetical protein